jgi:hypothetical protein
MMGSAVNWTNIWSDLASICVFLAFVYGIVKWVINRATDKQDDRLVEKVWDRTKPYLEELRHNGGSSIKDSVGRMEADLKEVKRDQHRLSAEFQRHLGQHDIIDKR